MSELAWIVTRSSLPPVLREVLWEMIRSIDEEVVEQLKEIEENFRDRIEAIETNLRDEATQSDLLNVWDLKEGMDDEIGDLERRITALEKSEDPEEEAMEDEAKESTIEVELKEMEPQESDWNEVKCPYCGGKFEAGK